MPLTSLQLTTIRKLMLHDNYFTALSALRGPDFAQTTLKTYTTAVVRSLLGVSTNVEVQEPADAKSKWEILPDNEKAILQRDWYYQNHFREHIIEALLAIGTPEAIDYGEWLEHNLNRGATPPQESTPP